MAQIRLQNLVKRYENGFEAVKNANLEIADGEFLVLVGPSGCGKSTTLRMIAGLEEVTSGDIFVGDTRVNDLEPGDRDIAMVFQDYALYPHMSIHDNIGYPLKVRGTDKTELTQQVTSVANQLQIGTLLDRRPAQLSGGQQQMVAIGRAMMANPEILMLDEPSLGLSPLLCTELFGNLSHIRETGMGVLLVEQNAKQSLAIADRGYLIENGAITGANTAEAMLNDPAVQTAYLGAATAHPT